MKAKTLVLSALITFGMIGGLTSTTTANEPACQEILDQCEANNPFHWLWQAGDHAVWDAACQSSYDICVEQPGEN